MVLSEIVPSGLVRVPSTSSANRNGKLFAIPVKKQSKFNELKTKTISKETDVNSK
jgi:hypothetical protein